MKKKRHLSRILAYFRPHAATIVLCMAMAAIVNAAELLNPYLIKIAIDDHIVVHRLGAGITAIGLLYLGVTAAGALANYAQAYLLNSVVQKIMHGIRVQLFTHIQRLPLTFFDRNSSGRILTRVTNDVEALNEMYSGVLVALFKDVFLLGGIAIMMARLSAELTLLSLTLVPLIAAVVYFYKKKAVWNFQRVRALIAAINGFLAENISGMKLVQIFHRECEKYREFQKLNGDYNRASIFEVRLQALFRPSAELINNLGIALLLWYSTPRVFGASIQIGLLYAFITYVKKFFNPINDLADKVNTIFSGMVSAERIFELLDNGEGREDPSAGLPLPDLRGEIEFRQVWFAYGGEDWVLKDVSFRVEPGQTVAFVGATGSGKSTIINLIGRFYEIQRGEILLDGVDIKRYNLSDLRRRIAVVMQDVFLFAGDIAANISLENPDLSEEDVRRAAEFVRADRFIERLPGGYHEEVKERGCTLSTGQRQLLSFARAVACRPAILVLDEATANIDTETELVIQDSLARMARHRTTLIIAHRLSTIKNADLIIVIHKGRIREMGKHDELLARDGIYRKLYEMQYA